MDKVKYKHKLVSVCYDELNKCTYCIDQDGLLWKYSFADGKWSKIGCPETEVDNEKSGRPAPLRPSGPGMPSNGLG
jgi:hypothetical protein